MTVAFSHRDSAPRHGGEGQKEILRIQNHIITRITGIGRRGQNTHPNVAVLVIWFPVPSCVAVEETVPRRPIGAAIATLCCYGANLLS